MSTIEVDVVTINDDFTDRLTSATREMASIMCFQEVWRTRLGEVLDTAEWGVHQFAATDPSRANSAVVWRLAKYRLIDADYTIGCHRDAGDAMRDRWLAWVLLEDRATGKRFYVIAGHRPPQRERDNWPEFDANSGRFVKSLAHPVIYGTDANQAPPTPLIRATGMRWHGIGIDGFLVSAGVKVADLHQLPKGASDHHPVVATFTIPEETTVTGLYPGAKVLNIPPGSNDPAIKPRLAILHVDAGNATSLHNFFNGPSGGIESHFHVRKDGVVEQYRSIYFQADANLKANDFAVSIETQGFGAGTWNAAQLAAIKKLLLWLNKEAGIPLVRVPRWDGAGVGYHIMFGAPGPWTPVAKSCPGPDRIKQFETVLIPWMKNTTNPPKPTRVEQARALLGAALANAVASNRPHRAAAIKAALNTLPKR